MGKRALGFSVAHPDTEPGTAANTARLEQLLARANEVARAQRDGIVQLRAASEQKEKLRREMLEIPIAHLAEVGRAAAREEPELGRTFRFSPTANTFLAFRTAARSMAAAAEAHREVLLKYGLSEAVLTEFLQKLDQFDAATELGNSGRTARMGATRELNAVSTEIQQTVRLMDGRNRQRFANDQQLLGSWISASRVLGTPRPTPEPEGETPAGGEVKPAA